MWVWAVDGAMACVQTCPRRLQIAQAAPESGQNSSVHHLAVRALTWVAVVVHVDLIHVLQPFCTVGRTLPMHNPPGVATQCSAAVSSPLHMCTSSAPAAVLCSQDWAAWLQSHKTVRPEHTCAVPAVPGEAMQRIALCVCLRPLPLLLPRS